MLLRLLTTVDAELATTVHAEHEAIEGWRGKYPPKITFPADSKKRNKRVAAKFEHLGFPPPQPSDGLSRLLRSHRLIIF